MPNWIALIIAIGLIGTVIWAFKTEIQIPAPFTWAKGLIVFIMILVACGMIWNLFVGARFGRVHF